MVNLQGFQNIINPYGLSSGMITVVGAGPAGSYAAYMLAKAGKRVRLLEEHKAVGLPVQCTGLVTQEILKYVKPRGIVNKIHTTLIFGGRKKVRLKLRNPNLVLDRRAFDSGLAKLAVGAGARLILGTRVRRVEQTRDGFLLITSKGEMHTNVLIGADGPLSIVARQFGLRQNPVFFRARQAIVPLKPSHELFFQLFPGGFAWLVPATPGTGRAGVATMENPDRAFGSLLDSLNPGRVLEYQGGIIPIFSIRGARSIKGVYLIGDAAGFVKPTTGGGIVQGLCSASLCAEAIIKNTSYERLWRTRLAPELLCHSLAFSLLSRLDSKGIDALIEAISQGKAREFLEEESRDRLLAWLWRLALASPRLALLARAFFCPATKFINAPRFFETKGG